MSAGAHSRAAILAALRAGLAAAPFSPEPAPALPAFEPPGPDPWARLAERNAPLGVRLRLAATPEEAARHVADIARERQAASYVRWADLESGLPPGLAEACDAALAGLERLSPDSRVDLARADLGLTGAQAALLDSGSLALVAGCGRQRAVSLLPPLHVCLVPRRALAPDIAALPGLLARDGAGPPSCLNLVTGPSSTADIELVLVRGVHGPGALEVVGLDWG